MVLSSRVCLLSVCVGVRFGVVFVHKNTGLQLRLLGMTCLPVAIPAGNPSQLILYLVAAYTAHVLPIFPIPCSLTLLVKLLNLVTLKKKKKKTTKGLEFSHCCVLIEKAQGFESCLTCYKALVYFRIHSKGHYLFIFFLNGFSS